MQVKWTNLIELTSSGVSRIREMSGVYRLSYLNPQNKKYYVFYVGQADDLKRRLTEHLSENETNPCCKKYLNSYSCYFRTAVVLRQEDRDGAEVALYNHFNPSCPDRIPDVEPLDINFN